MLKVTVEEEDLATAARVEGKAGRRGVESTGWTVRIPGLLWKGISE